MWVSCHHLRWNKWQLNTQRLNKAKANIKISQQKQKELCDRKHANPKVYQVGSKVLKKDFARKKKENGCQICGAFYHHKKPW